MRFKKASSAFVLRFIRGERFMQTLHAFLEKKKIAFASLQGIGAASDVTLGFYDVHQKKYFWKTLPDEYEVVSLIGNVSRVDGKPFVHVHLVLGDRAYQCVGGHLQELTAGATLEIVLTPLEGHLERTFDDAIGLKLLACPEEFR